MRRFTVHIFNWHGCGWLAFLFLNSRDDLIVGLGKPHFVDALGKSFLQAGFHLFGLSVGFFLDLHIFFELLGLNGGSFHILEFALIDINNNWRLFAFLLFMLQCS